MKKYLFPLLALAFFACDDNENRQGPGTPFNPEIIASTNTGGEVFFAEILSNSEARVRKVSVGHDDADGIVFDNTRNRVYQANRSDNAIVAYSNVSNQVRKPSLDEVATVSQDTVNINNARGLAFNDQVLVLADDVNPGAFSCYQTNGDSVSFLSRKEVTFQVWGVDLDGNDLYAVVDEANRVNVYSNVNFNNSTLPLPQTVTITGMVRSHGIHYEASEDLMILTDIGAASSATDGGLHIIPNWSVASIDGVIAAFEQTVISGSATELGNPVDVAYDASRDLIIVAERANEGGKIMWFRNSTLGGNMAPDYQTAFAGASSVAFER